MPETPQRIRVQLDEVGEAMSRMVEDPFEPYLDLRSGRIIFVPVDEGMDASDEDDAKALEEDPDRFLEIPRLEGRDEIRWMVAFARGLDDERVRRRLLDALDGKGAFSRFRRVLHDELDVRDQWFAVRDEHLAEEARDWLESHDVPFEGVRRKPIAQKEPPPPRKSDRREKAPRPPPLRLVHMLLLGAPHDAPDPVDGPIRRRVLVEGRARRDTFESLVRDFCAMQGVDWRPSMLEGKRSIDVDGIRIVEEDRAVSVDVTVPDAIRRMFPQKLVAR